MKIKEELRHYMASIGSKGGKTSRRKLTKEQSRAMLQMREFRRACRKIDLIPDPIERARAFGIDISLLEANLELTPAERLRQHEEALAFGLELQEKVRQKWQAEAREIAALMSAEL